MTVSSLTNRVDFTGSDSVGPFSYPFRIFDATDLTLTKLTAGVETTLSYPTDYSVTGVMSRNGGSVTLTTALATGSTLTIRRVLPLLQETELRNQGTYYPEDVEDMNDRAIMITQQLSEVDSRAVSLPVSSDPSVVSPILPAPGAGEAIFWNTQGTALETRPIASSGSVALPGDGRQTDTLTAYLANNAVYELTDFIPPGTSTTADMSSYFQNCFDTLPQMGAKVTCQMGQYRIYNTIDIHGYYGSAARASSSTTVELNAGCIMEWWGPAETPMFRFPDLTGQDSNLIFKGGQLEGVHGGINSTAIEIHSGNVTVKDTAIRNFTADVWNANPLAHTWQTGYGCGIKYVWDLIIPPICPNVFNVKIFACGNGVWSEGCGELVIGQGSRIEANQGFNVMLSSASKTILRDFVCEGGGFNDFANLLLPVSTPWPIGPYYAPHILIENAGETVVDGVWLEDIRSMQRHDSLTIQGVTDAAAAITVSNSRFVNYHGTCISIGENGGQVIAVHVGSGNEYVMPSGPEGGTAIAVGSQAYAVTIEPGYYSQSTFQDGAEWLAATAYVAGDVVVREGSPYVCILASTGNEPPNITYWAQGNVRYSIAAGARVSLYDVNQFYTGHTITHQNIDMVVDGLTIINELRVGDFRSDAAVGAGNWYRTSLDIGRVSAGASVRKDLHSVVGNAAAFNAAAGTRPSSPTVALAGAGAGNVDNGIHSYKITYYDAHGESAGGISSAGITVVDKTANGKVSLTAISTGQTGTVGRRIYRTRAGGTYFYLLDQIADNATTIYTDNISDATLALGVPIPTVSTTNDWQAVLMATSGAASVVGNVHDQPMSCIANNVEQFRWDNTGLVNARLGVKVAGTQVLSTRQVAIASPTAPSAGYVQAEAASAKTAIDAIRAALIAHGLIAP